MKCTDSFEPHPGTRFRGAGRLSLSASLHWIIAPVLGEFFTCFFQRNHFVKNNRQTGRPLFHGGFAGIVVCHKWQSRTLIKLTRRGRFAEAMLRFRWHSLRFVAKPKCCDFCVKFVFVTFHCLGLYHPKVAPSLITLALLPMDAGCFLLPV